MTRFSSRQVSTQFTRRSYGFSQQQQRAPNPHSSPSQILTSSHHLQPPSKYPWSSFQEPMRPLNEEVRNPIQRKVLHFNPRILDPFYLAELVWCWSGSQACVWEALQVCREESEVHCGEWRWEILLSTAEEQSVLCEGKHHEKRNKCEQSILWNNNFSPSGPIVCFREEEFTLWFSFVRIALKKVERSLWDCLFIKHLGNSEVWISATAWERPSCDDGLLHWQNDTWRKISSYHWRTGHAFEEL